MKKLFALFVLALPAFATTCPTGYSTHLTITIPAQTYLSGTLSNYPAPFVGNAAFAATGSGGSSLSAGTDVIFCTALSGGNLLPYELVPGTYNSTTGAGVWWVQNPTVSNTTPESIYAFVGKASATDQSCGASGFNNCGTTLWNGYLQVHHFGTSGSLTLTDSTGNCTSTNHGATAVAGPINGAANFVASSSQYIDTGCTSNPTAGVTYKLVANPTSFVTFQRILSNLTGSAFNGYETYLGGGTADGSTLCQTGSSGSLNNNNSTHGTIPTGAWSLISCVAQSGSANQPYINGAANGSGSSTTGIGASSVNLDIGRWSGGASNYFNGSVAEVQVFNGVQSADIQKADYISWIFTAGFYGAPATAYTISGPSTLLSSSAGTYTASPNGAYSGTVTFSDGGSGGVFTPTSLTWTASPAPQTFTYSNTTAGSYTLNGTSSPTLSNGTFPVTVTGFSTITTPAISLVSHGSAYATWTLSSNGYCSLLVGLTSGGPYTTIVQPAAQSSGVQTLCASNLSGLAPSTTYYVVATGRPTATSATGQVISSESTFTTLALPSPHPAFPTPITPFRFTPPDISSYTAIPITTSGAGNCVAASSVANPGPWHGSVTAGDSLRQIVECEAGPKSMIDFPEGIACTLPLRTSLNVPSCAYSPGLGEPNVGMYLQDYGAPTDYMLFRTHPNNPQDFAPFGYRTDPTWYGQNMATISVVADGTTSSIGTSNGQLFSCYGHNCGNLWMQNIHVNETTQAGNMYPVPVENVIQAVGGSGYTQGHFIIDRNWFDFPFPDRVNRVINIGGSDNEIIGNYAESNYWYLAQYPTAGITSTVNTITYPGSGMCWGLRSTDTPSCPASGGTITIGGSPTGTPSFFLTVKQGGQVVFYYDNSTGATASCSGTNCVTSTNLTAFGVACGPWNGAFNCGNLNNEYLMASGTFTSSSITVGNSPTDAPGAGWYDANYSKWATIFWQPDYGAANNTILNNLVNCSGQCFYSDPFPGALTNLDFENNQVFQPFAKMGAGAPGTNGLFYRTRQPFEIKRGAGVKISGNVFDGSSGQQNYGWPISLPSSGTDPTITINDVTITDNLIRNTNAIFSCVAYGNAGPDGPPVSRVWIHNLLIYNHSGFLSTSVAGVTSGNYFYNPAFSIAGCNDLRMDHITYVPATVVGNVYATAPGGGGPTPLLFDSSWSTTGALATFNISEGLLMNYNVFGLSVVNPGVNGQPNMAVATNQPVTPSCATNYPTSGCISPVLPSNQTTQRILFPVQFVNIGASITPSYNDTLNALVLGQQNVCCVGGGTVTDITGSTFTSIAAGFDSGFNIIPGSTLNARYAAFGFSNPSANNYSVPYATASNSGIYGVNYNELYSGIGLVRNIAVVQSATTPALTYAAPDTGVCYADVSSNGFSTWTRYTDSGGYPFNRTLALTGLNASTAYGWRLSCRYRQANIYTNSNDYTSDELSDGSFTTLAAGTRSPSFAFNLGDFSGATSYKVALTSTTGTQYTNTCTTSPCLVSGVPVGDYSTVRTWLLGTAVKGSSGAQIVSVR